MVGTSTMLTLLVVPRIKESMVKTLGSALPNSLYTIGPAKLIILPLANRASWTAHTSLKPKNNVPRSRILAPSEAKSICGRMRAAP